MEPSHFAMRRSHFAIGRFHVASISAAHLVVKEVRLGLDTVYVQAKRWQATFGRPEIQKFAGSLQAFRGKKGIFITTSEFSREAEEFSRMIDTTNRADRRPRTRPLPVRV